MRRFAVLGLIAVSGLVLAAQGTPVPVIVAGVPGAGPKTAEERAVFDRLQVSLAEALQGALPCASPTTSADMTGEYEDAKAQQSAGSAEGDALERMRAAAGAQDVVSVKVTGMGGQFVVDVAYMDMRTGRTQARMNAQVDGSEGAIDSFASQFADSIQKLPQSGRFKGCTADRDWSGTISYRFNAQPTTTREQGGCKEEQRSKESWRYTVRIPASGSPSAVIQVTRLLMKTSTCVRKGLWCGTAAGSVDQTRYGSETWQWIGAPRVEPRVTFDDVNGKLYTSLDIPMVKVDLSVEGETRHSTPCDNGPSKPSKAQSMGMLPARVPALPGIPLRPGQKKVKGGATDKDGGTVTWRLIRTNRPD